jgi:glyoxylase-like metal-dependent hydrolase (beta-lactamase superfamily II)
MIKRRYAAPGVLHIPLMPRSGINCYLIEDVLIDAGIRSSHRIILPALQDLKVSAHALTHAHADHQGSSRKICDTLGIPLWCSEPERPQAASGNATKEYPFQRHLVTRFQQRYWAEGRPSIT